VSLVLLTLSLFCVRPAQAQGGYPGGGYPGGSGGGYPGGSGSGSGSGSGGGTSPDPGHYWKITYSNTKGKTTWAIPDSPSLGQSTPQEYDWSPQASGDGLESEDYINTSSTGSVTATLTWIPAAGMTLLSDPPAKMVSIEEFGTAEESPSIWNGPDTSGGNSDIPGSGSDTTQTQVGSATNGLGDTAVAWNRGYISTGTHRVRKDATSGTITLGPFTLTATCPASNWTTDVELNEEFPLLSYEYHCWDWMGGLCEVGFGVKVVPPAHPVNFRCVSASSDSGGVLHYDYAWDSSTGNLADLDGCTIKERVSYGNNVGGVHGVYENTGQTFYIPPAPFAGKFANPQIYGGTSGTTGSERDDHYVPSIPGSPTIPGLYEYGAFNVAQEYIYTDDNSDPNNPNDYTVLRGPIDIDREVYAPGMNWIYRITKYDAPEGSSQPYAEATLVLGPVHTGSGP